MPTAASIYRLFLFVIIWHVDISVKELTGFSPIYPEPNINLELYEVVSEFIEIVVLFGFLEFCIFIFPDTSK